ncbi:TMV resistance protein N-like protein [Tanacetum coccineum]
MRLFNRYAFTKETPIQWHKELSRQVVNYAHGLPLTIKVLGSLLCGQNEPEWKDALKRLKTIPLKETMKILELSYDALDDDYKEIFLDVACLLKGWEKDEAIIALESCGFHARNGLRVLEQRSLITISELEDLGMHDHIEEMGKNIVRRVNPNEPKRHSRLWIQEEIEKIMANDWGTQPATKCIRLLETEGLNLEMLMKELRFLHVNSRYFDEDEVSNWSFDEDSIHLPNALRFLRWEFYPFSSLPKTFQPKNLVGLEMLGGKMVQLWKDGEEKPFPNLRFLKFTLFLLRTLDLSVAPNLESLILINCHHLEELDFQVTPNLKELHIRDCGSLEKLHIPAESQKLINLSDCTDMVEVRLPAECPNLETLILEDCGRFESFEFEKKLDSTEVVSFSELHLTAEAYNAHADDADDADDANGTDDADDTGICDPINTWPEFKFSCDYKEDPASSFGNLGRLISLGFGALINADSFSDIICGLQCLRKLTLEGGIPEAPKNLDRLDCLKKLSLRSTDIKTLPDSICMLKHLKSLEIVSCCLLEKLPEDIGRLQCLKKLIVKNCIFLRDIPNSICEMDCLECLDLTGCIRIEELPEVIGCLEYLKELDITRTTITRLPKSLYDLKSLKIRGPPRSLDHDSDVDVDEDDDDEEEEDNDTGISRLPNLKGLGVKRSTQILESCGITPQIQKNVEDGEGCDDNDDYIIDVDEDGGGDGGEDDDNDNDAENVNGDRDDEFDYEYARLFIMTMLSSRT